MLLNGIESDYLVYHASGKMYVETTGISGYNPKPDDIHECWECMDDWHDYEWNRNKKIWIVEGGWRNGRDGLK